MARTKGKMAATFMYPSLHQQIMAAVSGELTWTWFQDEDSDKDSNNEYSTHIMGKFRCINNRCATRVWTSKKIAITIRGYLGNGYNAVVYNQRCKSCTGLGDLEINEETYIDRVAYRIKKWAGIRMEHRDFISKKGPPHEKSLCEGCMRGVCQEPDDWEYV